MPHPRAQQSPPSLPGLRPSARRGSVLVVALLFAALVALALGSYLGINLGAARLSTRSFSQGAAFHLAETGLEEALWSYNRPDQAGAWEGWQISGDAAWRRFEGFQLTPSVTGSVKVYASPLAPSAAARPSVVALASVQHPAGAPSTQLLEVTLARRSLFTAGIVARESIAIRGRNASFDAWDSDPDKNPATPAVPYSPAVRTDRVEIAVGASTPANLELGRAQIFGRLRTRIPPSVSSPGRIGPFSTPEGIVDFTRVGLDYNESLPVIAAPDGGELLSAFGDTLGTPGRTTIWRARSLKLSGGSTLTLRGEVILILTDPLDALSLSGNAALLIPEGSSLALYLAGDAQIGGRGIVNDNPAPGSLQLWSTATPARLQRISLGGRAVLRAALYAPEAEISISGNAEFFGSLIGRHVVFAGNVAFHHDLALVRVHRHGGFGPATWSTVEDPARRTDLLRLVDK